MRNIIRKRHAFTLLFLVAGTFLYAKPIEKRQICKAALSLVMGVEPQNIRYDRESDGVFYLSYTLEEKGEPYRYRCKIEPNRVIWGSEMGRWRTKEEDALITYTLHAESVTIYERFNDEEGISDQATFTSSAL